VVGSFPACDPAVYSDLQAAIGPEAAAVVLTAFLGDAPGLLAAQEQAAACAAWDAARRAAHTLKSAAAAVGALALAHACARRERRLAARLAPPRAARLHPRRRPLRRARSHRMPRRAPGAPSLATLFAAAQMHLPRRPAPPAPPSASDLTPAAAGALLAWADCGDLAAISTYCQTAATDQNWPGVILALAEACHLNQIGDLARAALAPRNSL
jgi:hypothetical protein